MIRRIVINLKHPTEKKIAEAAMATNTYIYCGRGRDGILGNPFTHIPLDSTLATFQVKTREEAIQGFEDWIIDPSHPANQIPFWARRRDEILQLLPQLKDKEVFGCWCAPLRCHCEVIIKLINKLSQV